MTAYNIQELAFIYQNDPARFFTKLRFDMLTAAGMISRCPSMAEKKLRQLESGSEELSQFQAEILPLIQKIRLAVGSKNQTFDPEKVTHHFILDFYIRLVEMTSQLDKLYAEAPPGIRDEINQAMGNPEFYYYYTSPVKVMQQLLDVMKEVMMA